MIGCNDHLLKVNDSDMLEAAKARFFAAGGAVTEVAPGFCNPDPIAFIQPRITPAKVRKSRAKSPEDKQPRRPSVDDLSRQDRDAKIAEMAKTMTGPEVARVLGLTRGTVVDIGRRRGFSFLPTLAIDPKQDAEHIAQILRFKAIGLTRAQCCRRMDISVTKLVRLLEVGNIDFPTASPGRPR